MATQLQPQPQTRTSSANATKYASATVTTVPVVTTTKDTPTYRSTHKRCINPKNLELITCWHRPSHPNPTYEGILKNIERIIPSKYLHPPANFHHDAPIIKISAAAASKITSPVAHRSTPAARPMSPSTLKAQSVECQLPSVVNRPSPTIHHSPPKNDEDVTFEDDDTAVHCRPTVSAPTTTATHIKPNAVSTPALVSPASI